MLRRQMYLKSMLLNFETPAHLTDKENSQILDQKYGFNIDEIEKELCVLHQKQGKTYGLGTSRTWVGLHPQIFQTPYAEIDAFLKILKDYRPTTIVDLGAGYGRVGLVMQKYLPESTFYGYEFVKKRCLEGNRIFRSLGLKNCRMHSQNIIDKDFKIPRADVYFIYDFSDQPDQKVILDLFSKKMESEKFFIVVRGKSMRSLIQNKYPEFFSLYRPHHEENWSIYSTHCDV